MKGRAGWFSLLFLMLACAATRPPTTGGSQRLEIRYAISAARPATQFELTVPPTGGAELVLLAPLGSEPSPLGHFRGPVTAATRAALERCVEEHDLLDADPGESATSEGSGSISLTTSEGRVTLGLATDDAGRSELRGMLDTIVRDLIAHPVAAIRTELGAKPTADGLVPVVSLVHVGSEPLDMVLVDGDLVVQLLARVKPPSGPERELSLEAAQARALVASGALSSGTIQLEPGQRIDLPLPSAVPPGSHVSVTGHCWYPRGRARTAIPLRVEGDVGGTR